MLKSVIGFSRGSSHRRKQPKFKATSPSFQRAPRCLRQRSRGAHSFRTKNPMQHNVTTSGVHHFWSPPNPGERVLGMIQFQDVLAVATDEGVYVITDHGRPLPDWEVRKISHDLRNLGK